MVVLSNVVATVSRRIPRRTQRKGDLFRARGGEPNGYFYGCEEKTDLVFCNSSPRAMRQKSEEAWENPEQFGLYLQVHGNTHVAHEDGQ